MSRRNVSRDGDQIVSSDHRCRVDRRRWLPPNGRRTGRPPLPAIQLLASDIVSEGPRRTGRYDMVVLQVRHGFSAAIMPDP